MKPNPTCLRTHAIGSAVITNHNNNDVTAQDVCRWQIREYQAELPGFERTDRVEWNSSTKALVEFLAAVDVSDAWRRGGIVRAAGQLFRGRGGDFATLVVDAAASSWPTIGTYDFGVSRPHESDAGGADHATTRRASLEGARRSPPGGNRFPKAREAIGSVC